MKTILRVLRYLLFRQTEINIDSECQIVLNAIKKTNKAILKHTLRPKYSRIKIATRLYSIESLNQKLDYCLKTHSDINFKYIDIFDIYENIYLSDFMFSRVNFLDIEKEINLLVSQAESFVRKYSVLKNTKDMSPTDLNKNRLYSIMFNNIKVIFNILSELD